MVVSTSTISQRDTAGTWSCSWCCYCWLFCVRYSPRMMNILVLLVRYAKIIYLSFFPLLHSIQKNKKKWLSSNLDCTTLLLCSLYFGICVPLARLLEQNQRKVRPKRDRLVRRMERERREEGVPTYPPPINNGVCTVSKTLDGYTGSMGMAPLMGTLRSCIWLLNVGTSVAYLKSESHKEPKYICIRRGFVLLTSSFYFFLLYR